MGPAELVQATAIARQYYVEGMTKVEIADFHGLSRYKVARILEACRTEGIVRVEINGGAAMDTELSERLRTHFRLKHALVASGPFDDVPALRAALGRAAADLLTEIVTEDDVLGVAWGRTLDAMAQRVNGLPPCRIVQMTGIAGAIHASSVDLVRRLTSVSGGPHHPIYAPLVASDPEALRVMQRQQGIQAAVSRWRTITVAAVAVGAWDPTGSQVHRVLTESERAELDSLDTVCEICSIPLDADGRPVRSTLTERTMAIPYADLVRIPEVIAVAGGEAKTDAVRAALRGGVITSLVTDSAVAAKLLAEEPATEEPRR
ncbi:sugar-binding transcriptional regulator [Streptomyces luteolus]|uniref:Sugar-binding domain-containing protein n=1 Tax=Streptomyces luteolus TaxID=3043615 RepID=A0ABT6SVJ3_9ACTN|nr:sugar-binding domain-containing protein [Streptomyces sp. B-S-A12]MDI3418647.1 sugar-binding domain-containing protein [Streptomyces sp. B-S-A12]